MVGIKHIFYYTIALFAAFSCIPSNNKPASNSITQIDSITIWYHKENIKPGQIILEERFGDRMVFMEEDANAAIQIEDSLELELLSKLIMALRPRDQLYVGERVMTKCAIVVHKSDVLDTLAIADVPPARVQVKADKYIDSICEDSLLCKTVWDMIAQKDTFWLNHCHDGGWYKTFWMNQ